MIFPLTSQRVEVPVRRFLGGGFLLVGLSACADGHPVSEASGPGDDGLFPAGALVLVQSSTTPIATLEFVVCANGGGGEWVSISGDLQQTLHTTETSKGNLLVKAQVRPQGVSAVGMTTGLKYNAVGVSQQVLHLAAGLTTTIVNNFRLVSQGPGPNLQIHENHHLTVNPDGTITSEQHHVSVVCGDQ